MRCTVSRTRPNMGTNPFFVQPWAASLSLASMPSLCRSSRGKYILPILLLWLMQTFTELVLRRRCPSPVTLFLFLNLPPRTLTANLSVTRFLTWSRLLLWCPPHRASSTQIKRSLSSQEKVFKGKSDFTSEKVQSRCRTPEGS